MNDYQQQIDIESENRDLLEATRTSMNEDRQEIIGIPYNKRTLEQQKNLRRLIRSILSVDDGINQCNTIVRSLRKEHFNNSKLKSPMTPTKRPRDDDSDLLSSPPRVFKYTKLLDMKKQEVEMKKHKLEIDLELAKVGIEIRKAEALQRGGDSEKLRNDEKAYRINNN